MKRSLFANTNGLIQLCNKANEKTSNKISIFLRESRRLFTLADNSASHFTNGKLQHCNSIQLENHPYDFMYQSKMQIMALNQYIYQ